jgi:hypothetical protein
MVGRVEREKILQGVGFKEVRGKVENKSIGDSVFVTSLMEKINSLTKRVGIDFFKENRT